MYRKSLKTSRASIKSRGSDLIVLIEAGGFYSSIYGMCASVVTKAVYIEAEAPGFEFEGEAKTEAVDPKSRPRPRQQGSLLTKVTCEQ